MQANGGGGRFWRKKEEEVHPPIYSSSSSPCLPSPFFAWAAAAPQKHMTIGGGGGGNETAHDSPNIGRFFLKKNTIYSFSVSPFLFIFYRSGEFRPFATALPPPDRNGTPPPRLNKWRPPPAAKVGQTSLADTLRTNRYGQNTVWAADEWRL